MGKRYSNSDCEFLKINYPVYGQKFCADKLNRNIASIGQKAYKLKLLKNTMWTNEETEFLKKYCSSYGYKYCADKLNRSYPSINAKANYLGLKSNSRKRKIVQALDNNKFLCECKRHGTVVHHNYKGASLACSLCTQENYRKFNKTEKRREYQRKRKNKINQIPINNFANRLRASIRYGIKRISKDSTKIIGCFRNLDYTPVQLYNYLTNIQKLQNNKCPHCDTSYDKCVMSIDHVIPLERAKTEQEIIDLFCLQNLNLMCKICNSSKNKNGFSEWLDKKKL